MVWLYKNINKSKKAGTSRSKKAGFLKKKKKSFMGKAWPKGCLLRQGRNAKWNSMKQLILHLQNFRPI